MTKLELVYITAFYEGEGCCAFYRYHSNRFDNGHLTVRISQNEKSILTWIKKKINMGSICYVKSANCYYLHLGSAQSRRFLKLIQPYMRVKKKIKQLKLALSRDKKYILNPRGIKC